MAGRRSFSLRVSPTDDLLMQDTCRTALIAALSGRGGGDYGAVNTGVSTSVRPHQGDRGVGVCMARSSTPSLSEVMEAWRAGSAE